MSRRHLKDQDIERALEEIYGISDNCDSEDGLEFDEDEEYNSDNLRNILQGFPAPDIPIPEQLQIPIRQEESATSQPISDEESSECEESNESEIEEDEPWNKKMWVSRPDPEVFDEISIAPTYLLNNR